MDDWLIPEFFLELAGDYSIGDFPVYEGFNDDFIDDLLLSSTSYSDCVLDAEKAEVIGEACSLPFTVVCC